MLALDIQNSSVANDVSPSSSYFYQVKIWYPKTLTAFIVNGSMFHSKLGTTFPHMKVLQESQWTKAASYLYVTEHGRSLDRDELIGLFFLPYKLCAARRKRPVLPY
ncbi:hypothetical protein L3Q82_001067 [Scortum barcoo]|uniref:Uncharacterized protein n=1 Tax=Scortum barcoo TaxID=214431 RepID=A0ACB8WDR7_9TELE|nr:hypothetical protein L3Q82_001067 [Scortum barcoo]